MVRGSVVLKPSGAACPDYLSVLGLPEELLCSALFSGTQTRNCDSRNFAILELFCERYDLTVAFVRKECDMTQT